MYIAVLGAGPSGLVAAHAAASLGHDVCLYDAEPREPDGQTAGVFYLHQSCDLDVPSSVVRTSAVGTRDGYRDKVYGPSYDGHVSYPAYETESVVWDGMAALAHLWSRFQDRIIPAYVEGFDDVQTVAGMYDRTICTIPAMILAPHLTWESQQVTVATRSRIAPPVAGCVIYEGHADVPWYRYSDIFGRETYEYVPNAAVDVSDDYGWTIRNVEKVVTAPRANFPDLDNVMFAGRYGAWNKRCLTHDVYRDVRGWLNLG